MRPTTLAGLAALLRYLAEFPDDELWQHVFEESDEDEVSDEESENDIATSEYSEFEFLKEILMTLADAVRSIRA